MAHINGMHALSAPEMNTMIMNFSFFAENMDNGSYVYN